ncbi:MAG TPA: gamma-glutamyl-gamma-aminobutyrate hydrolase family protein [Ktedonobacterales bacterium]|nr:gamma-glutamyl-gamma-aminobutyrate hydrolase family protein [Ktedonobacterales bacterium]
MSNPLIGIPTFATLSKTTQRPLYANNRSYARAIERAGGAPVFIPLAESDHLDAICDTLCTRLDGLLLSGGADIDPAFYHEERLPECGEIEPERDLLELALTRRAMKQGLPIFGICRGIQLLNVACGGSLYQDIQAQRPESLRHPQTEHPRDFRAHSIRIEGASRLATITGAQAHQVNSLHHQAVKDAGAGLTVTAWAEDGVIEAMEARDYPFALAVQYHPEELAESDPFSQQLFVAFVQACQK